MKLRELFREGKFVVTSEVGPPKGTDTKEMLANAELLRPWVDALNITDQQSSVMRLASLAAAHLLKERGLEPIFQLTCRDRNRIALQSDLLSAWALGVENVLCLTGDYVSLGDHPSAKPVFDLDSVSLLATAKRLNEGFDLAGNELQGKPDFCLGAVVTPGANPVEMQLIKMERKLKAGAEFFQTQAVYEPEKFARFMEEMKSAKRPVIAGIILLKSAGMARFMNKNVAGVHVPEPLIEEMEEAKDRVAKSIEIVARLIREIRPLCQGVHIMPIGWERHVPAVLEEAGLGPGR
ncbi:MAG: methylenetetrahydrofolate reductase [Candidatus Acetothermia bacterium]|jgi:5,10-methylenetetrahydrofolate reductase|nr:methylenetetrahydrofolate reductase [Candidatus Acetothermia bacterium]MDH7505400.1 methylenetetrahydrofolate reductase [Candidatus Acetothermia bacterium]